MSNAARIFVSHTHTDNVWCREFVASLRQVGLDVWYDEHNLGYGRLMDEIDRELMARPIFIVVISPESVASQWVRLEMQTAMTLQLEQPERIIVPVVAQTATIPAFWRTYKRVSGDADAGLPAIESAHRLARMLALEPQQTATANAPAPIVQLDAETSERIERGKSLIAQQKYQDALAELDAALQMAPDYALAHVYRADAMQWLERYQEALEACDRAIALDPSDARCYARKGAVLLALEFNESALEAYEQAIKLDAPSAAAHVGRGDALRALKRPEEALTEYEFAITNAPKDPRGLARKASLLYWGLNRKDEALDWYERAIQAQPAKEQYWREKVNALDFLHRDQEAREVAQKAIRLYPHLAWPYLLEAGGLMSRWWGLSGGEISAEKRFYEEALRLVRIAISIEPNNAFAHFQAGNALERLGQPEDALSEYQAAVKLNADKDAYLPAVSRMLVKLQRIPEAVQLLEDALSRSPRNPQLWDAKAEVLAAAGDHEGAIAALDKALALATGSDAMDFQMAHRWRTKANALEALQRYDEAIKAYDQVSRLQPRDDNYGRKALLERLTYQAENVASLRKLVSLAPKDSEHLTEVARRLDQFDERSEALQLLIRATELDPENYSAWRDVAGHYRSMPLHDQAIYAFDKCIALKPKDRDCYKGKIESLRALKRYEEALQVCEAWIAILPVDAQAHADHARILKALQRDKEALAAIERAIAIDNDNAMYWEDQSHILSGLGRDADAKYARALAIEIRQRRRSLSVDN